MTKAWIWIAYKTIYLCALLNFSYSLSCYTQKILFLRLFFTRHYFPFTIQDYFELSYHLKSWHSYERGLQLSSSSTPHLQSYKLNSHTTDVTAVTISNIDYSNATDITSEFYYKLLCDYHSIRHYYFNFSYPVQKVPPLVVLEALHNPHFRAFWGFILALMDSNDLSASTFVLTAAHQISQNVFLVEVEYELIVFSFILVKNHAIPHHLTATANHY